MSSRKDYNFFANSLGVLKYHLSKKNDEAINEELTNFIDNIKHYFKSDNSKFKSDLFDLAIQASKEELQTLEKEEGYETEQEKEYHYEMSEHP